MSGDGTGMVAAESRLSVLSTLGFHVWPLPMNARCRVFSTDGPVEVRFSLKREPLRWASVEMERFLALHRFSVVTVQGYMRRTDFFFPSNGLQKNEPVIFHFQGIGRRGIRSEAEERNQEKGRHLCRPFS